MPPYSSVCTFMHDAHRGLRRPPGGRASLERKGSSTPALHSGGGGQKRRAASTRPRGSGRVRAKLKTSPNGSANLGCQSIIQNGICGARSFRKRGRRAWRGRRQPGVAARRQTLPCQASAAAEQRNVPPLGGRELGHRETLRVVCYQTARRLAAIDIRWRLTDIRHCSS